MARSPLVFRHVPLPLLQPYGIFFVSYSLLFVGWLVLDLLSLPPSFPLCIYTYVHIHVCAMACVEVKRNPVEAGSLSLSL